ncbi:uncharacterized protein LOC144451379 isoform X2 [Glandiceps talaboti]
MSSSQLHRNLVVLLVALTRSLVANPLYFGCFSVCPAGYHKVEYSKECQPGQVWCRQCDEGTYTAVENELYRCFPHRPCNENEITKLKGTFINDFICECQDGYYRSPEGHCRQWTSCTKGKGVFRKGDAMRDTVCQPCGPSTYSDVNSSSAECINHTRCEDVGLKTLHLGTSEADTVCKEASELISGKPSQPTNKKQTEYTTKTFVDIELEPTKTTNNEDAEHFGEFGTDSHPTVDTNSATMTIIIGIIAAVLLSILVIIGVRYIWKRRQAQNQAQDDDMNQMTHIPAHLQNGHARSTKGASNGQATRDTNRPDRASGVDLTINVQNVNCHQVEMTARDAEDVPGKAHDKEDTNVKETLSYGLQDTDTKESCRYALLEIPLLGQTTPQCDGGCNDSDKMESATNAPEREHLLGHPEKIRGDPDSDTE